MPSRHSARIATQPGQRAVHLVPATRTSAYTPRHAAKTRTAREVLAPPSEPTAGVVAAAPPASTLSPDRDLALNPPQDAQLETADLLQVLDARWRVLHAVPLGDRGNVIGHLVVGPAGVFIVDIKHHPEAQVWVAGDTFKVNGRNQRYLRNCRQVAARAAKLLSARAQFDVDVRVIIAVAGTAHGLMVKEQPADGLVSVVTAAMLVKHLESLPNVLGAPSRGRIYEVARHLATWQAKTVGWTEF